MASKTSKAIKISQKHLLGIQDLSVNDINIILNEAQTFISINRSKNKKIDALRGKTQINLFFEPSTRTQSSFELAGKRLGADVMSMNMGNSSIIIFSSLIKFSAFVLFKVFKGVAIDCFSSQIETPILLDPRSKPINLVVSDCFFFSSSIVIILYNYNLSDSLRHI